jgi:hypothetical protein
VVASARELVVHVGTHKTGTTLLQRYVTKHLDKLVKRGAQYVEREEMAQLVGWGERLRSDPQRLRERIDELAAVPGTSLILASHEDLIGQPFRTDGEGQLYPSAAGNIAALGQAIEGYSARLVLSVRPQDGFLESYYLQSVHEGGHRSFERWLQRVDLDRLSYLPLVDALSDVCGAENVRVVDFGRIKQGAESFLEYFLRTIDPRLDMSVEYHASHNRSLSAKGLQMALAANARISAPEDRRAMRFFLQKHYSNADYPRAELLSDELREQLRTRYQGEYEQLVGHGG